MVEHTGDGGTRLDKAEMTGRTKKVVKRAKSSTLYKRAVCRVKNKNSNRGTLKAWREIIKLPEGSQSKLLARGNCRSGGVMKQLLHLSGPDHNHSTIVIA